MASPVYDNSARLRELKMITNAAYISNDKQRLPSADKRALMDLANTPMVKRYGRQQPVLQDIAKHCREQDISDLSGTITKKVTFKQGDGSGDAPGMASLSTSSMRSHDRFVDGKLQGGETHADLRAAWGSPGGTTSLGLYRSYTMFPRRKVIKTPRKDYSINLPKLRFSYRKGVIPSDIHSRSSLITSQKINGPIQLDHYLTPKEQLAPLTLPSIQYVGMESDKLENFLSSKAMSFGGGRKDLVSRDAAQSHASCPWPPNARDTDTVVSSGRYTVK